MSIFSDSLKHYIEKNNIRVLPLARYCDIERSTVYKFITGKRLPHSLELVEKMAQFMRLSPLETEKLKNAWKIVSIGPDIYYSRKSVEDFICHFPCKPFSPLPVPSISVSDNVRQDCTVLSSQQYIDNYVHQIILAEANKKHGKIGLFLQPDYPFLFRLLSSLNPSGALIIDHIICLQPKPFFNEQHQAYNIQYLTELFPVYINGLNYNTWYYYNDIQALFHNPGTLPCMILTSDAAILCSSDYQNGIFIKSPDVVQLLWNQFISYKEQCSLFFRPAPLTPENHKAVIDSMFDTFYDQNDLIGIQPEPCLTPFFTGNLLHEIFNYDLPQADAILAAAEQAFQMNMVKIQNEQFLIYSTREGLLQFAKTGLTDEIPEIFYHPLTVEQRIEILNGVRQCCETGVYRFLQKPLSHLPHNLHFCIRGTMGSMVFRNNTGQIIVLNIEETCLVSIFRDYLEHMNPASYYSTEKAVELVDQIIHDLQDNRD